MTDFILKILNWTQEIRVQKWDGVLIRKALMLVWVLGLVGCGPDRVLKKKESTLPAQNEEQDFRNIPTQVGFHQGCVVATHSIIADWLNEILPDSVPVKVLVPGQGDAHSFEPKPQDLLLLEKANWVIATGLNLEDHWLAGLMGFQNPKLGKKRKTLVFLR